MPGQDNKKSGKNIYKMSGGFHDKVNAFDENDDVLFICQEICDTNLCKLIDCVYKEINVENCKRIKYHSIPLSKIHLNKSHPKYMQMKNILRCADTYRNTDLYKYLRNNNYTPESFGYYENYAFIRLNATMDIKTIGHALHIASEKGLNTEFHENKEAKYKLADKFVYYSDGDGDLVAIPKYEMNPSFKPFIPIYKCTTSAVNLMEPLSMSKGGKEIMTNKSVIKLLCGEKDENVKVIVKYCEEKADVCVHISLCE